MTRDCGHSTGDDQRLQTTVQGMTKRLQTVQEMSRDCGHSTGDDQRLQTVQGMTRDCRQYRG
ncbi:unnamed protein product [Staurois parvus]|uniref:Uncharacterized protein n=1 Tax=Staurois parvus TaxID=386267 RepID=A0ABN9DW12_9NEOB|nr:unnamed protein product [Staurois parvus]